MTTLPFVLATAFSLVLFVMIANVIVDLYARGAVRAAVDEAARPGARLDAGVRECNVRAHEVLDGLVGARLRSGIDVSCATDGHLVTAHADVRLASWLAWLPAWHFSGVGSAVKERDP